LLLEAAQVGTDVKRWLRAHLLLLVERYLMIELLEQELRVVEDVGVLLGTSSSTLFGFDASVNLCLILS
jgi:hypothetical protein